MECNANIYYNVDEIPMEAMEGKPCLVINQQTYYIKKR